jgi:hypothetical protein
MEIVSTNTRYPFDELERLLYNSIHGLELSLTKLNCCFRTLRGSQSFKKDSAHHSDVLQSQQPSLRELDFTFPRFLTLS